MRRYLHYLIVLSFLIPSVLLASSTLTQIPDFVPNVVDPEHFLTDEDTHSINAALQQVRETSGIMPAVYIVGTLGGDNIEELSNAAFQKWKLGSKGFDNGLLLVLSMHEHKSRFEVGYGLEGSITDVVSKMALDEYLRPHMRKQNYVAAITESFNFLSQVHLKDPQTFQLLMDWQQKQSEKTEHADDWKYGLAAWLVFTLSIWLIDPVTRWRAQNLASVLERDTKYKMTDDPYFTPEASLAGAMAKRMSEAHPGFPKVGMRPKIFIKGFLTLNPGIFIFIAGMQHLFLSGVLFGLSLLIGGAYFYYFTSRYSANTARNKKYLDELKSIKEQCDNVRNFPLKDLKKSSSYKSASGDSYSSSSDSSWSSSSSSDWSSSSSSDSFSSSSDGGSSGGGGSSSDW